MSNFKVAKDYYKNRIVPLQRESYRKYQYKQYGLAPDDPPPMNIMN